MEDKQTRDRLERDALPWQGAITEIDTVTLWKEDGTSIVVNEKDMEAYAKEGWSNVPPEGVVEKAKPDDDEDKVQKEAEAMTARELREVLAEKGFDPATLAGMKKVDLITLFHEQEQKPD